MKYKVQLDRGYFHMLSEIADWCRDNIGPGGYIVRDHCVWEMKTTFGHTTFYFKREKDMSLFVLRWV